MKNLFSLFFSALLFSTLSTQCSDHVETNTVFLPLPVTSTGLKIGPEGYAVESFGEGTYMVTDGSYQCLFVASEEGVILVDLPPTIGKNIFHAIGNITSKPITHFVYSHTHADHIGTASLVANLPGVEIIAHEETTSLLRTYADPSRPVPTKSFKHEYVVKSGNQTLHLSYKGENHCRGNIFIYAPASQVLMLVDVVFPGWAPFSQLAVSSNIPGWLAAHDQILTDYPHMRHYIGGHLGRSGNRTDVLIQKEYMHDLLSACTDAIGLTATSDPVLGAMNIQSEVLGSNPGNYWAVFKVYLDLVAERCANVTSEKWLGKLGAVDVFAFEGAYAMVEHLRLDFNVLGPFRNI
jgi:glyoxylase-like metal-dependent hydrolase (beta-lactamase superfamily II)